jgi:hypothetical protein
MSRKVETGRREGNAYRPALSGSRFGTDIRHERIN